MRGIVSAIDPYQMPESTPTNTGFRDTRNYALLTSVIGANTKCVIIGGQSNHANSVGTSAYTVTQAGSHILNPYDGGIYAGGDPMLGTTPAYDGGPAGALASNISMVVADRIIANGKATTVVICNIAVGGTPFIDWRPTSTNSMHPRLITAILRCRARGLEPDCIIWGQGETDNILGTSAASVTASIQAIVDGIRAAPVSYTGPFYIGKFTLAVTVSATVQTGIANSIDAGRNIVAGYDADTNATVAGGFRNAGDVHLSNTGRDLVGQGWADLIFP